MHPLNLIWQYESPGECEWIRFLLSDFALDEIADYEYRSMLDNSVVVMSSRRTVPLSYIALAAETERCILYHISDESYHGRYTDYMSFNFIFRNYLSSAFDIPGIKTVPLGYFLDTKPSGRLSLATERQYIWSFFGAVKSSRPEMLNALKDISPHFVHHEKSLDSAACVRLMQTTIFCPCPMGSVVLETNRLYEALEAGCIPIVETRPTMRYYERLFPGFPPPRVRSWSEASKLISRLLSDPVALDAKQQEIAAWWNIAKLSLRAEVTRIVEECFFSGKQSRKLSQAIRPTARLPGWRQFELLRHQSLNSTLSRAKLEFGRLMAPEPR